MAKHRVVPLVASLLASTLVTALHPSARAVPHVNHPACDSIIVGGTLLTRVTFEVGSLPMDPPVCLFAVEPLNPGPGDSCRVLHAAAPPAWAFFIRPEDGGVVWEGIEDCVLPGEVQSGFQIALDASGCCYRVLYFDATSKPFAQETVCFDCSRAVPTTPQTWGRIKSRYR